MIIACDIDGVLADVRYYVKKYLPDWNEYFKYTLEFPPIPENIELLRLLIKAGNKIYLVTGRPISNRDLTKRWILENLTDINGTPKYKIHPSQLFMRTDGDTRPTEEIKLGWFRRIKPDLIIDDSNEVEEVCTKEGFKVLKVCGYRISKTDGIPFVTTKMNWNLK